MSGGWKGKWRWYLGSDEHDDEMCQCDSRETAIAQGVREWPIGESFWIVEARMHLKDEAKLGDTIDAAPFAETRNGCWIENIAPEAVAEGAAA